MYKVYLENRAKKELKKLDNRYQEKVLSLLHMLENDPFVGEKMAGQFYRSYRIKIPPLRIIYTPDLKNKSIWIKAIGFRGGVYK